MNSKPDRQFTHNIFAAFPVTFLIVALAYPFLGFHPDMPVLFPMLAYFWHTLFVLLGAVFAAVFKKYRYFAYPLVVIIAFLCRNI
ncbi:MAG: hypothetical protein FWH48_11770, partial [Oscillospiraceae bacterium]|nr:hypothetical protein [Oscillospiraceae bacterium]